MAKLRADSLMVGDYILVEGKPRRIESITKKKIGYHLHPQNDMRLYYARLHEIEPIEINDYILRTSGFCVGETEKKINACFDNDKTRIDLFVFKEECEVQVAMKDKETYSCYVGNTRFVHELQHAIRLCGIDFEIKL